MKLYFCWEHTSTERFAPVMYHDHKPGKSVNGGGPRIASGPYELPEDEAKKFLEEQSFGGWLKEKYPPPEAAA